MAEPTPNHPSVHDLVRDGYGQIAERGGWSSEKTEESSGGCCAGGGCCGPATFSPDALAKQIGYDADDLAAIPDSANLGLSCGNPGALAALRPGEVVIDLGSGAGFDCFIAGRRVGPDGRVIGVDMTPEMLRRARTGVSDYARLTGFNNVEFRLGEIEHLPLADASADVVISNCVINLSPEKPQVWREIARVLKPGGRVAISDLALLRPLPESITEMVEALVGCVSGASLIDDVRRMAEEAGLIDVQLTSKPQYIDAMMNWEDPLYRQIVEHLPAGTKASDFITSLDVHAVRPSETRSLP